MNVLSISASISVTTTDIWTKFGTDLKFHNVYRQNGQIHNLKIQDAGCLQILFKSIEI